MITTFEQIKNHRPCFDGWILLLDTYKPESLSLEVSIKEILESNGIRDTIWSLRAFEITRKFTHFFADISELGISIYENKYPNCKIVSDCVKAIRLYADVKINKYQLKNSSNAASYASAAAASYAYASYSAACSAAYAASNAAYAVATADYSDVAYAAASSAAAAAAYAASYSTAAYATTADDSAAAYAATCRWHDIEKLLLKYI